MIHVYVGRGEGARLFLLPLFVRLALVIYPEPRSRAPGKVSQTGRQSPKATHCGARSTSKRGHKATRRTPDQNSEAHTACPPNNHNKRDAPRNCAGGNAYMAPHNLTRQAHEDATRAETHRHRTAEARGRGQKPMSCPAAHKPPPRRNPSRGGPRAARSAPSRVECPAVQASARPAAAHRTGEARAAAKSR